MVMARQQQSLPIHSPSTARRRLLAVWQAPNLLLLWIGLIIISSSPTSSAFTPLTAQQLQSLSFDHHHKPSGALQLAQTKSSSSLTTTSATSTTTIIDDDDDENNDNNNMAPNVDDNVKFVFGPPPFGIPTTDNEENDFGTTLLIGKREVVQKMVTQFYHLASTTNDDNEMMKKNCLLSTPLLETMLDQVSTKKGGTVSTFVSSKEHLTLCILPNQVSRHLHPLSVHQITKFIKNKSTNNKMRIIVAGLDSQDSIGSIVTAIARAFPLYNRKTSSNNSTTTTTNDNDNDSPLQVHISCLNNDLQNLSLQDETKSHDDICQSMVRGIRLACRLVDMTPEELTTTAFAQECRAIADKYPDQITMTEIIGTELQRLGYGGLYGVGKAANCPPRLVVMEYKPPSLDTETQDKNTTTTAFVGKGICYDTGGLSLKSKTGMPGMKTDMGGAAAILGGFLAAVEMNLMRSVVIVLCLAENAIGPDAVRNDDILTLYSGKTVEINNCDAEGRLVLGDGVAHVTKHFCNNEETNNNVNLIVDMATLTGAQMVCTGKVHAAILANTQDAEDLAIKAGMTSGDVVFPLLYAPDLLMSEFASKVADMKNSVKDRGNAQTSCAGHFIESHLNPNYEGNWVHVDLAGPSFGKDERATGFGVGLMLALLDAPGFGKGQK